MSQIYRKADMQRIFGGCSSSTIDRMEQAGLIPQRIKLNPYGRNVGWYSDDVDQALAAIRTRAMQQPVADSSRVGQGKAGPGRGHRKQLAA